MSAKVVHTVLAVLFGLFALLQYNDPDPLIWILIYGAVALIALLKIYLRQVNFKPLIITLIVIMSLYALTYFPGFMEYLSKPDKAALFGAMKVKKPWVEETRELFGLLIAIGALVYLRKSKAK